MWLVLVALLSLAGCSAPDRPAPKPVVCASGRATFGTVSRNALLTGVTPVLEATNKGMTLNQPYAEIGTRTAGVQAGAAVPAENVYQQLSATLTDARALVDYGTVHHPAVGESATFDGTGRFVSYEWIRAVSAPFSYTCDGATSSGVVTSWEAVKRGGVLNCDEPSAGVADDAEAAMTRQVRKLRCQGN